MTTSADNGAIADGEAIFRILAPGGDQQLFLRRLGAERAGRRRGSVLYVHGATFPSALSIAYRFQGRSWRDALCEAGFDVWGLDFLGFGGSGRLPEMLEDAQAHGPLLLAEEAAGQVEAAVRFIIGHDRVAAVSLITHSWGSMPAGLFAAAHPALIDRIVMFAPPALRRGPRYAPRPTAGAWRPITLEDQWNRFTEDALEPVLPRADFAAWGEAYLDSDPGVRDRDPPAVKVPTGPFVEILRAWHGELAWQPEAVRAPVCIIRGAWDGLCTDEDARWLFDRLTRSAERRDVKISRGTHLMHLEEMRPALWRESIAFLQAAEPLMNGMPMQDHHDVKDLPDRKPGGSP